MGMYTELYLAVDLKRDTPDSVIDTLKRFAGDSDAEDTPDKPDSDSFRLTRQIFFKGSYYFQGPAAGVLEFDESTGQWQLLCRYDLKNYEGEHEAFIRWLAPHVDPDHSPAGHIRYEEQELPTLIYFRGGPAEFVRVTVDSG